MSKEFEKDEVDREIASLTHTISQISDDHPDLPFLLVSLGASHTRRFKIAHGLGDLEKAIEYRTIALTLTREDDPRMPHLLLIQGAAYGNRFIRLGELDDINTAIEHLHLSAKLTAEGDPGLIDCLINLGAFHIARFDHLGNVADLEDSIKYQTLALALAPEDPRDCLPATLDGLGISHRQRFERMGRLNDLDDAIAYQTRGVSLTPDEDTHLPGRLTNLGISHRDRFERLGELTDLEKAIEYESRALALTPADHPEIPSILMNLSASHGNRFLCQKNMKDLESAIEYQSHAVALTLDEDPKMPSRLANLGRYYTHRFTHFGELNDLEDAIEYQSHALAITPSGRPELPIMHANLALSHKMRFGHQDTLEDLEIAVKHEARALTLAPEDHPDYATWQFNHAQTQRIYFRNTRTLLNLCLSQYLFRCASKSLYASPHKKLQFAQEWARAASNSAYDCIEAYQTAIDLLPQVIWLGSTTNQRYDNLLATGSLAADAAAAATSLSEHSLALEWLEHARCVVWNQHLMLRSPLDHLMLVNSDLATRLQTVATQLHSVGSESREPRVVTSCLMATEQVVHEHHQLATDYDDLLVQIRQLEGFDDFLRPMKVNSLVHAARTGPVVVINCHEDRCDGLIILPGVDIVHRIALPGFSAQKAEQARRDMEISLRAKGIRERGVKARQSVEHVASMAGMLATLWYNIVKPILEFLGCMNDYPTEDMPHLTWCPTGALSFLPLHAAGDYDQPRSRVFDYVISSYTPTVTALLASTPSSLSTDCRLLAIGQAATPGHSPLPGTEIEIAHVRAHTENNVKYTQLLNDQATVPAVLDAMEHHDWVHLACHAHQNVMDPTRSGFFLHNGTLDLAAINRRSFRGKGLAFLSACQTATGDKRLADEAVHLASGMLMAGYTSVIGTMWSVHDVDAPVVADRVYAQLMKDRKLGNGESGRALHNAMTSLREKVGEQKFERWVPYIHIGS